MPSRLRSVNVAPAPLPSAFMVGSLVESTLLVQLSPANYSPLPSHTLMLSAMRLPNRTEAQCFHRWQKVLNPEVCKGPWTKQVRAAIQHVGRWWEGGLMPMLSSHPGHVMCIQWSVPASSCTISSSEGDYS